MTTTTTSPESGKKPFLIGGLIGKELLICNVCSEYYKDPRILPCDHTFCRKCLQGLHDTEVQRSAKTLTMPCPKCQQEFVVPQIGISGLPLDLNIRRMKEEFMNKLMDGDASKPSTSPGSWRRSAADTGFASSYSSARPDLRSSRPPPFSPGSAKRANMVDGLIRSRRERSPHVTTRTPTSPTVNFFADEDTETSTRTFSGKRPARLIQRRKLHEGSRYKSDPGLQDPAVRSFLSASVSSGSLKDDSSSDVSSESDLRVPTVTSDPAADTPAKSSLQQPAPAPGSDRRSRARRHVRFSADEKMPESLDKCVWEQAKERTNSGVKSPEQQSNETPKSSSQPTSRIPTTSTTKITQASPKPATPAPPPPTTTPSTPSEKSPTRIRRRPIIPTSLVKDEPPKSPTEKPGRKTLSPDLKRTPKTPSPTNAEKPFPEIPRSGDKSPKTTSPDWRTRRQRGDNTATSTRTSSSSSSSPSSSPDWKTRTFPRKPTTSPTQPRSKLSGGDSRPVFPSPSPRKPDNHRHDTATKTPPPWASSRKTSPSQNKTSPPESSRNSEQSNGHGTLHSQPVTARDNNLPDNPADSSNQSAGLVNGPPSHPPATTALNKKRVVINVTKKPANNDARHHQTTLGAKSKMGDVNDTRKEGLSADISQCEADNSPNSEINEERTPAGDSNNKISDKSTAADSDNDIKTDSDGKTDDADGKTAEEGVGYYTQYAFDLLTDYQKERHTEVKTKSESMVEVEEVTLKDETIKVQDTNNNKSADSTTKPIHISVGEDSTTDGRTSTLSPGSTCSTGPKSPDFVRFGSTSELPTMDPAPPEPDDVVYRATGVWELQNSDYTMPTSVAVLSNNTTVVAEFNQGQLQYYDSEGKFLHSVTGVKPFSITTNAADHVIVADRRTKTVRVFDEFGGDVTEWERDQFKWVSGIACLSNGNFVIQDRNSYKVGIYTPSGGKVSEFGSYGERDTQLCMADFLTVDSHDRIIMCDSGNHCIKIFNTNGRFVKKFGVRGHGLGEMEWPKGVCCDGSDNVIVADNRNSRVSLYSPDGEFIQYLVTRFPHPYGVCLSQSRMLGVTHYALSGASQLGLYKLEEGSGAAGAVEDQAEATETQDGATETQAGS